MPCVLDITVFIHFKLQTIYVPYHKVCEFLLDQQQRSKLILQRIHLEYSNGLNDQQVRGFFSLLRRMYWFS